MALPARFCGSEPSDSRQSTLIHRRLERLHQTALGEGSLAADPNNSAWLSATNTALSDAIPAYSKPQ